VRRQVDSETCELHDRKQFDDIALFGIDYLKAQWPAHFKVFFK